MSSNEANERNKNKILSTENSLKRPTTSTITHISSSEGFILNPPANCDSLRFLVPSTKESSHLNSDISLNPSLPRQVKHHFTKHEHNRPMQFLSKSASDDDEDDDTGANERNEYDEMETSKDEKGGNPSGFTCFKPFNKNLMENDEKQYRQRRRRRTRQNNEPLIKVFSYDLKQTYDSLRLRPSQAEDVSSSSVSDVESESGYYRVSKGEVINNGEYTVIKEIGRGSFAAIVEAIDNKTRRNVAIKIIKKKQAFFQQAQIEIRLLNEINLTDPYGKFGVVKLLSTFIWKGCQCLVFELLSQSLFDILKSTKFEGISFNLLRKFSEQMLRTLSFLARPDINIIHYDIKPENILMQSPPKPKIKLIDFSSSCKAGEQPYTYVQSRYYRSPESILGLEHTVAMDMWSLACVMLEMHCGKPAFPGVDEHDQLRLIISALGMPPTEILEKGTKTSEYFDKVGTKFVLKARVRTNEKIPQNPRTIEQLLGTDESDSSNSPSKRRNGTEGHSKEDYDCFIDLIYQMLNFDPVRRIKPLQALLHPFIQGKSIPSLVSPSSASVASYDATISTRIAL